MESAWSKHRCVFAGQTCSTKKITVVDRPLNEWMTNNILALKAIRRKNELIWRKTRITINFNIYYDGCMAVKKAISIRKAELRLLIVKVTRRNCFLSYILYLVVKRSQCCQNILALLLWHLQSTCFLLRKFIISKWNFLFWKRVYQRIRLLT